MKLRRGELIAVPPPEDAERSSRRRPVRSGNSAAAPCSEPAPQVREELERIALEYGAREVIVVTITHDHAMRRRSYELLADAFELVPRTARA